MTCADDLKPTAAETDTALVFTADGYSDADGVDHVTVATKAVAAAETALSAWDVAEAVYIEARAASDKATDLEMTATNDDHVIAHEPIHSAYLAARSRLMNTTAPHWAAVGMKAEAFLRMWGDDESARYAQAARSLATAAGKIGKAPLPEADVVDVMAARGYAERLCYFLAHDDDGYRNWACCVGGVGRIAGDAERIADETRDLAKATPIQQAMSGEIISAVWFGKSAVLDAHEPPRPPTWDALVRAYGAAKEEASERGTEIDAVYDDPDATTERKERATSRYEAAQCLADTALEAIIDRPVTSAGELVTKHQLAADRWLLGTIGETLADTAFVDRIASEKEATRWIMGRLHQDLQRLAGIEGECEVARQAARFAEAVVRHRDLDGAKGDVVEAECDAQWHTMIAAETAAEAGSPTSRAGVAFQLLCAVGEIDTVENGRDDDAKEEAGEKIRTAVANAIAALGLPFDPETAQYFLGDRLARRLAQ